MESLPHRLCIVWWACWEGSSKVESLLRSTATSSSFNTLCVVYYDYMYMVYREDILILHVEKIELSYIMKVLEIERTMVVPIVETKTKKGSFLQRI